jgi:ParB family chromosome partitioning protein
VSFHELCLVGSLILPILTLASMVVAQAAIPITRQLVSKPVSWLKADLNQPRKFFCQDELRLLGESMRVQQVVPILCRSDGTIIDGERRFRAAQLVGLTSVDVIITDEVLSAGQLLVTQLTANLARAGLSDPEVFLACKTIMEVNKTWTNVDLARHLGRSQALVTHIMSVSNLIPEAVQAFMDGKIRVKAAYNVSLLPPEEQSGLLALYLSGMPVEQVAAIGRQQRKATTSAPAVKVSKIRCDLPGSVCVTVSGEGVSLEDGVDALGKAMTAMKRAIQDGFTARTFAAAMKDKSSKP